MSQHKAGRLILLLATAGALTGGAIAAASSAASPSTHAASPRIVHVIEHAVTDTEMPSINGKDAKGNLLVFNNPVFNKGNARQVGHDEGFCTRISVTEGSWECLWTTFLKNGQITVQGPFYDTRNSVLSITGGTGDYRTARGQMRLLSRNGGTEYDFIFELS